MTDYRDRHFELRLSEELGGEHPPDQVQAILEAAEQLQQNSLNGETCLNGFDSAIEPTRTPSIPAGGHSIMRNGKSRRRSLLIPQFAIAASILLIVFGTVVLPLIRPGSRPVAQGGGNPNQITPLHYQYGLAIPETSETINVQGQPMLRDGWVFVQPQSHSMLVGLSQVRFDDARAVVRIGRVPDSYDVLEMARTLASSKIEISQKELEMLKNTQNWITGFGLAVCLLSGDMVLGQEKVSAPTDEPAFTVTDVFNRFDTNQNGTIEPDECVCENSKKCDLNQDGIITRSEFSQSVAKLAGSDENFIRMVAQHGGVENFYVAAKAGLLKEVANVSFDAVFAYLDQDKSGVLEKPECICKGSKSADHDQDGTVTRKELLQTAVKFFGSEEAFLATVREAGGVKAFFVKATANQDCAECSIAHVFTAYDKDQSGVLEKSECICKGSQMADANGDGKVTQEELEAVAVKMFGSLEKFEKYIESCGGAQKFHEGIVNGKIGG